MFIDWKQYKQDLGKLVGEIGTISPDLMTGYKALSKAGDNTGHLDRKTRELIAIAVAVTRQCDGCIKVHLDEAVKAGAKKEEIVEALGVAINVNAGAALVYSSRVMDALSAREAQA
jgi:AhpD family alkylhydroperoxidase